MNINEQPYRSETQQWRNDPHVRTHRPPHVLPRRDEGFLPKKGRRDIAGRLDRLEDTAEDGQNGPGNAYTTGEPADMVLTETDYAILDEVFGRPSGLTLEELETRLHLCSVRKKENAPYGLSTDFCALLGFPEILLFDLALLAVYPVSVGTVFLAAAHAVTALVAAGPEFVHD